MDASIVQTLIFHAWDNLIRQIFIIFISTFLKQWFCQSQTARFIKRKCLFTVRASVISGLFEDCFQDYCPAAEAQRSFHAQLQTSDAFKLKEPAIPAGRNFHRTQITRRSVPFDEW